MESKIVDKVFYVESEKNAREREALIYEALGPSLKDTFDFREIVILNGKLTKIMFQVSLEAGESVSEEDCMLLEKQLRKALYKIEEDGNSKKE